MSRSDKTAIIAVIGIVCMVFALIGYMYWSETNGIRVFTDEPSARELEATGQSFNIPIEIRCYIEYDGDFIVSKDSIVDFCYLKETEKQMKQEMKMIWKEMRRDCQ